MRNAFLAREDRICYFKRGGPNDVLRYRQFEGQESTDNEQGSVKRFATEFSSLYESF